MSYKYNPKTIDSGVVCCIPNTGICPRRCPDCFFQNGRSYLEPLNDNLPNMPDVIDTYYRVVRVNDGHDSATDPRLVMEATKNYEMKFYNTSYPARVGELYDAPVVVTINAPPNIDKDWYKMDDIPTNLMMVRFLTNTWNLGMCDEVVNYYTAHDIAVVLTFMAYHDEASIHPECEKDYMHRKRTLNSYYAITTEAWRRVMFRYMHNPLVYSCGRIEGERGASKCRYCGNCLREYFACIERMRKYSGTLYKGVNNAIK